MLTNFFYKLQVRDTNSCFFFQLITKGEVFQVIKNLKDKQTKDNNKSNKDRSSTFNYSISTSTK